MELRWLSDSEKKIKINEPGLITATIHLRKDESFLFPDSVEKVIRRIFSDALNCGYCEIINDKKVNKSNFKNDFNLANEEK